MTYLYFRHLYALIWNILLRGGGWVYPYMVNTLQRGWVGIPNLFLTHRGWVGIPIAHTGDGWVSPILAHRGWESMPILGHFSVVCNDSAKRYIRKSAIDSQSHSATVEEAREAKQEAREAKQEEKVGTNLHLLISYIILNTSPIPLSLSLSFVYAVMGVLDTYCFLSSFFLVLMVFIYIIDSLPLACSLPLDVA